MTADSDLDAERAGLLRVKPFGIFSVTTSA